MRVILDREEADRVRFNIIYISDRQERPSFRRGGVVYECSYTVPFKRKDMFWVNTVLDGTSLGAFCIVPNLESPEEFEVLWNYFIGIDDSNDDSNSERVRLRAAEYFKNSLEYIKQVKWTASLKNKIEQDKADGFETRPVTTKPKEEV